MATEETKSKRFPGDFSWWQWPLVLLFALLNALWAGPLIVIIWLVHLVTGVNRDERKTDSNAR